jgi:Arc/MetJ-type ribon-helix-helix transcriptional regulator
MRTYELSFTNTDTGRSYVCGTYGSRAEALREAATFIKGYPTLEITLTEVIRKPLITSADEKVLQAIEEQLALLPNAC